MTERLPVFVYGTLRTGGRNAGRLAGAQRQRARLPDHALYELSGLPYCAPRRGGMVLGELVRPGRYEETLTALDRLEGHRPGSPGPYRRVAREVETADGERVRAWVYVAGEGVASRLERHIPGGDWLESEGTLADGH